MSETRKTGAQDLVLVFRDLVLYCLLRWRSVVAAALVLAVLAGGYRLWQDTRLYRAQSQPQTEQAPLSDSSLARVTAAMAYENAYDSACTYNKNALLMHIDPEAVPTRHISYLITGQRPLAVATLLQKHLAEENLYTAVSGQAEPTADPLPRYLAELVSTTVDYPEAPADSPSEPYLLLHLEVIAPSEELCVAVAGVVKERIAGLTPGIRETVGSFACTEVYDRYAVLRSSLVRERQQNNLTNQNTLETKYTEAMNALSAAERDYARRLTEQTGDGTPDAPPTLSVKWVVLGLLAGGTLASLWLVLRYVFCRRVLSREDLALRYTFPVLGILDRTGKHTGAFAGWLKARLGDPTEAPELVCRRVAVAAGRAALHRVYLTGHGGAEPPESLIKGLVEQGFALTAGQPPIADTGALDALLAADALLVVEQIGESAHPALSRTLEMAAQCGKPVLGAVLVM